MSALTAYGLALVAALLVLLGVSVRLARRGLAGRLDVAAVAVQLALSVAWTALRLLRPCAPWWATILPGAAAVGVALTYLHLRADAVSGA